VWVDQRTGSEFNVEIGARVVATQAGQIVLVDDNEQVTTSNRFFFYNRLSFRNFIFLFKQNFVQCTSVLLKVYMI
jgi:hypothetical protein